MLIICSTEYNITNAEEIYLFSFTPRSINNNYIIYKRANCSLALPAVIKIQSKFLYCVPIYELWMQYNLIILIFVNTLCVRLCKNLNIKCLCRLKISSINAKIFWLQFHLIQYMHYKFFVKSTQCSQCWKNNKLVK